MLPTGTEITPSTSTLMLDPILTIPAISSVAIGASMSITPATVIGLPDTTRLVELTPTEVTVPLPPPPPVALRRPKASTSRPVPTMRLPLPACRVKLSGQKKGPLGIGWLGLKFPGVKSNAILVSRSSRGYGRRDLCPLTAGAIVVKNIHQTVG